MSRSSDFALAVTFFISFAAFNPVCAQDFRVYTRVFLEPVHSGPTADDPADSRPVSRSVSLFHASKVYDYVDTSGEVSIFEPAQKRFTMIDGGGKMAAVVTFEEIHRLLTLAEKEAEREAVRLSKHFDRHSIRSAELLLFLVNPQFQQTYDASQRRLRLTSANYIYDVRCDVEAAPEYVTAYLRYADWAARLNSVLHPHAFLPAPRIALNTSLRKRNLLPVEVRLEVHSDGPVSLRAEHQIHWNLDKKDRSQISHWESLLRQGTLKFVTFHEYQRSVLLSQSQ